MHYDNRMLTPGGLHGRHAASPLSQLAIGLVKLYQHTFGLLFSGQCKYYPSCSQYAIRAFRQYSFFIAFGKTVWRLLRCNPFSKGGVDLP